MSQKIIRHGIILITHDENHRILFLVVKHRYTYSYSEFLLRTKGTDPLFLINKMTHKEISQILSWNYQKIMDDFFPNKGWFEKVGCRREFAKNVECYKAALENALLRPEKEDLSMWEFPKGRKEKGESGEECAIREFKEETGIHDIDSFIQIDDIFIEQYVGDDGNTYVTFLYPMYIRNGQKIEKQIGEEDLSPETHTMQWMTRDECRKVLMETKMRIIDYIESLL
jgi:8-oxo-dGTP pyrophosphatase MutT (NUDIX family)